MLEQRTLGRTGLQVSSLGFGASSLGGVFRDIDEAEGIRTVHHALDLGINLVDVAPYYGDTKAETVLGRALRGVDRDRYVLATKCGRYGPEAPDFDFSADRVTRSIDESLGRLGVDHVDLIQAHDIEFGDLDVVVHECLPAMRRMVEAGKARFVGITGLPLDVVLRVVDRLDPGTIDTVLSYCRYSLNDTALLDALPRLEAAGIGVVNASPLAMGLLTHRGAPDWHPAPPALKEACRAGRRAVRVAWSPHREARGAVRRRRAADHQHAGELGEPRSDGEQRRGAERTPRRGAARRRAGRAPAHPQPQLALRAPGEPLMLTVTLAEPGRFETADGTAPVPGAGEALVRVHRLGVCGTDLHAFAGRQPFFSYPRILGHELGVEVLESDGRDDLKPGDRCCVAPVIACGRCIACSRGKSNACENIAVLGVHADGGMRDRFVVPVANLHRSETLSFDQLALVETLSIGGHAVDRAGIEPGETALVVGAGPIGLTVVQFLLAAGAEVVVMDLSEDRLRFCRETLGVTRTIQPGDGVDGRLREAGGGDLPTAVFDATGHPGSMAAAFRLVAHGGRLVFVGLFQGEVTFDDPNFHKRELTLLASRNSTPDAFRRTIALVEAGQIDTGPWISHRLKLRRRARPLRRPARGAGADQGDDRIRLKPSDAPHPRHPPRDPLRVGPRRPPRPRVAHRRQLPAQHAAEPRRRHRLGQLPAGVAQRVGRAGDALRPGAGGSDHRHGAGERRAVRDGGRPAGVG